jgi:hypothetical protein
MRCGACVWNRVLTHVAEYGDVFLLSNFVSYVVRYRETNGTRCGCP